MTPVKPRIPLVTATETSDGKIRIDGGLNGFNALKKATEGSDYKPLETNTETVKYGKHFIESNKGGIKTVTEIPGLPIA